MSVRVRGGGGPHVCVYVLVCLFVCVRLCVCECVSVGACMYVWVLRALMHLHIYADVRNLTSCA